MLFKNVCILIEYSIFIQKLLPLVFLLDRGEYYNSEIQENNPGGDPEKGMKQLTLFAWKGNGDKYICHRIWALGLKEVFTIC